MLISTDQQAIAEKIVARLNYYGWLHPWADESSVIQEIAKLIPDTKQMIHALKRIAGPDQGSITAWKIAEDALAKVSK